MIGPTDWSGCMLVHCRLDLPPMLDHRIRENPGSFASVSEVVPVGWTGGRQSQGVRWSHFAGQLGGRVKVYSE